MKHIYNHIYFMSTFRDPKIKLFNSSDITTIACEDYDFDIELVYLMGIEIEPDVDATNAVAEELRRQIEQYENRKTPNIEEVETINLGTSDNPREVKIGTYLDQHQRKELIELLKAYKDVFARSYLDMPGLNISIVEHQLPLDTTMQPIEQRLRRLKPEWSLKVKEEVMKQFNAGFLRVVTYPEWLANVVPVPKKDGKVRMCIDFRDLNKASPKDDFPLPHLDILVDNTAGHEMFSFMDGFSGYNQIRIAEEDQDKTAFITPWGVYCYIVMPFGLKNAGATYQKAMVTLFHDMIHKKMEVYVDDMIVKSRAEDS